MFKKRIKIRKIFPDIVYNNTDVEKFINVIMVSGKKSIARNIVYKSFNYIKYFYKRNPIEIFSLALDNTAPLIKVKLKKRGKFKNSYSEIKKIKRKSLSMKWIKKFSKIRKERHMYLKLANELIDASKKRGESFKKKESLHKIFDSKRSYKNK